MYKGPEGYGIKGICGGYYGDIEKKADARLIAAAPELLEALRDALSVCASVSISRDRRIKRDECVLYAQTEEWCRWVEDEVGTRVRAAIAKAIGEPL